MALDGLTQPNRMGKGENGEVMRSCWSFPVWCPQEASVVVPPASALGVRWKRSALGKPGVADRPSPNSSSTPHPSETRAVTQIHSWKEPWPHPHKQASATKQFRIIWVKLANDVYRGEWEPALEPRIHLFHTLGVGDIQAFIFSASSTAAYLVLSKEADAPGHLNCRCGLFGLITSTYHGLSNARQERNSGFVPECRASHGNTSELWAVVGLPPGLAATLDASQFSL